jgi:hypothetical protein
VPSHDKRAVACALAAVKDIRPDEVCIIGDFMDTVAPARWSKGTAAEYAGTLQHEVTAAKSLLTEIRTHYDGKLTFISGNHEDRIKKYLHTVAPAFVGLMPSLGELLEFEQFEVQEKGARYPIAPNTLAIHGNKLCSTQQGAGQSAFKERMRHGRSIVQGHSHRLGIGWDSQEKDRFWLEAGHLMEPGKAHYLDFPGVVNWTQGFGLLELHKGHVFPSVHAIQSGTTCVAGQVYAA